MWAVTFLQTDDMFYALSTSCVISGSHYTLHVCDLTVIARGGCDGGGVTVKNRDSDLRDCVPTFLSVKPLESFTSPVVLVAPEKRKRYLFFTLTKLFLCLNLSKS